MTSMTSTTSTTAKNSTASATPVKAPKKSASLATDPSRVAIVLPHFASGKPVGCDALLVRMNASQVEILDSQSFSGAAALDSAHSWAGKTLAARSMIMLSGSDVICRSMTLPPASPDQLEMALRLQVENLLLGGAARSRTNAALLPTSDPDRERIALMVEWTTLSDGPALPHSFGDRRKYLYAPPIAALCALVTGALESGEQESLAVYLERSAGAISIAYSNGIHTALRTVIEGGEDDSEWRASIMRSIGETLLLADIPQERIDSAMIALTVALDERLDGLIAPLDGNFNSFQRLVASSSSETSWWSSFGIMLGAALALNGPLARNVSLKIKDEATKSGIFAELLRQASRSKVAVRLAIATVLTVAVLPPGLSGLRLLYLQWQLPDSRAFERTLNRLDKNNAMYSQYERHAWPMTKLLGDLACATPEGIELESISISFGSPITVQGSAKPQGSNTAAEAILLMERQLRESRVFAQIEKDWDAPNANGVIKFRMSAVVANPSLVPNYPEAQDFARRTLRDRRYGVAETESAPASNSGGRGASLPSATEGTSAQIAQPHESQVVTGQPDGVVPAPPQSGVAPTRGAASASAQGAAPASAQGAASDQTAAQTAVADGSPRNTDSRSLNRRGATAGSSSSDATQRGRGTGTEGIAIPPPLTTEQISAMTSTEAREALGAISRARSTPDLDEATSARLRTEFYQLIEQTKKK